MRRDHVGVSFLHTPISALIARMTRNTSASANPDNTR